MLYSNENELLLLTGFSLLTLLSYRSFPFKNLPFDFAFWIIPQYLIIVYPESKTILINFFISTIDLKPSRPHLKHDLQEYDIPTFIRSLVSLMVAISIFAVDFSFFPSRFGKSDYYGYKFMDIGVGSYVYNAGMMSVKFSHKKNIKSIFYLSVLGFLRFFCIRFFGLEVNVREYGKYLNFYFVLAICNAIYACIRTKFDFVMGYVIILGYDYILRKKGLDSFILSDDPRKSLIEENKEGIFNVIGYISIFLMSNLCGRIYFSKYSKLKKLFNITFITLVFYSSYKTNLSYSEPSRRLCNATYVFWILFLHTFHILIYYSLRLFTGSWVTLTQLYTSKNMMVNFLLSNLLVLFFNQILDLSKVGEFWGNFLIIFYLLVSFMLPVVLSKFLFSLMETKIKSN